MKQFFNLHLKEKLAIVSTLLMFVVVILLIVTHAYLNICQSKEMAQKYLEAITEGATETVDCWLREKKNLIGLISESERVRDIIAGKTANISSLLNMPSLRYGLYECFFIADRDGEVIAASPDFAKMGLTNIKRFACWDEFEKHGFKTFLSREVTLSPISGRLSFVTLAGVRDEAGNCVGFVGSSIDWEKFIEEYILPIKVGQTGYVAVTDERGRNIGHPDRSLRLKDLTGYEFIKAMVAEKVGFRQYVFQGIPKFMTSKQSEESGWIVMASVSEKELVEGALHARNIILWTGLILLLCMLTVIGYIDVFRLGKIQKQLRESQRKFRLIFDYGNDGIFTHAIDDQGRSEGFREVNEAFCNIVQYEKEVIAAASPGEILHLDCKGGYESIVRKVRAEKYKIIETTMTLERGKLLHLELRLYLLEMESRKYILGFIRDITLRVVATDKLLVHKENLNRMVQDRTRELKNANEQLLHQIRVKEEMEKALRESEEKYRNLVMRAGDGIIVVQDDLIRFANDKMTEILKFSREELVGMEYEKTIAHEEREVVMDRYRRRIQGEKLESIYESRALTSDGNTVNVELNAGVINYEGRPADFIYVRDITERKRIADEKRRQEEQLIEADKLVALGTLVSGVAHEINNPNNSIMLNTPILRDAWQGVQPILDEYLDTCGDFRIAGMPYTLFKGYLADIIQDVRKSSNRIKVIVDDLKNFARHNPSELTEQVDVKEVGRASLNLVSNNITHSTRQLQVEYGEGLPWITGSFQRLEQVMVNLIQNSCHALEDQDRAIRISTKYLSDEGQVQIQVCDEGHGIKPEHMSKIMDPFFTTKRGSGGTGLGLSVSLRLIQEHRGKIGFESEVGRGTTATILLPATPGTVEADA
ncbi:MAG: PAS domain S-box protein [Syntrophobacteraceae bacterium]